MIIEPLKGLRFAVRSECCNSFKFLGLQLNQIGTLIWSPCRTTGHFLLLVFDDFESSLTILSFVHLVFIMGSSPLDVSLKRVSAMAWITIVFNEICSTHVVQE